MFRQTVRQTVSFLVFLVVVFPCRWAHSSEPADVDFNRDIAPLLKSKCLKCHGSKKREGGLRFTNGKDLLSLNGSGVPAVVVGNAKKSELIRRITSTDEDVRMPPEGKRLTDQQVELLRNWIDQGAKWTDQSTQLKAHWAYSKPTRPGHPRISHDAWPLNSVDYFILSRLEREGLKPSAAADRARLIRRVSLDLIGLPPNIAEVNAFVNDQRLDAFERVVDRLLKSPRYGEKWAQQWLDMARYADSNGYQADQFRTMWAYRDWVIDAMNRGMPFDQFTIDQIAGDLLPNASVDHKIATGFHRCPTCNVEAGVDPEENRVNQIADRVNTTATVWLGTTMECAQCHNHKYDPFTQKDYYQLFAFFNNTPMESKLTSGVTYDFYGPKMDLPLNQVAQAKLATLQKEYAAVQKQVKQRTSELASAQSTWESKIASRTETLPTWHVLEVEKFESAGGASFNILDDKSVLVGGKNPVKDTYTVSVRTQLRAITGFKLEGLLDDSLPGKGPGRQTLQSRANFVLTEFSVSAQGCDDESAEQDSISLYKSEADCEPKGFTIDKALDGDPSTGWSIHTEYHKPHHATFLTTTPIGFDSGTKLTFTLQHHYGQQRAIGRLRLSAMTGNPQNAKLPDKIAAILKLPVKKRKKAQKKSLSDYYLSLDPKLTNSRRQLAGLKKQLDAIKPATTLVMIEMPKSRSNNIFTRGNFLTKGPSVEPAVPDALHPLPQDAPKNRLGLANWLVDPNNPLVSRVTVNRWWSAFFGDGIVATEEDFGTQGEPPTHPRLLDWLAVEFVESGWSMKHIHKIIVMSRTYQQSSRVSSQLWQRDPYNRLYARGPRVRLSAETIRDNALAVSGLLSTKTGGPPIFPPQPPNIWRHIGRNAPKYNTASDENRFRRGVYVVWRRSAPYPSYVNFDAPDRAACVVQRSRTNTPLQALTLLNDPAYVEMATALAARMLTDHSDDSIEQRAAYGFRLALSRNPKTTELKFLVEVYRSEFARFQADPKAAERLIDAKLRPKDAVLEQLAAWFYVANILLNLDETITNG